MLPLATTQVTIERGDESGDPYEATTLVPIAQDVPAHIVPAAVRLAQVAENSTQPLNASILMDIDVPVRQNDTVTDQLTGIVYRIGWVRPRTGLGLEHLHCGALTVKSLV